MVTLVVHILLYIYAAIVPQIILSIFIELSISYILGLGDSSLIICTAWAPARGDILLNIFK
jgi:hypothetical protein